MSKILIDEATVKLVLGALKQIDDAMPFPVAKLAQATLREALAEQPAQQEPAFYRHEDGHLMTPDRAKFLGFDLNELQPLYTSPQPAQQEPVTDEENERFSRDVSNFKGADEAATMYALERFLKNRRAEQPAQRTWVGLTDKDITEAFDEVPSAQDDPWWLRYSRAIEAKLKEKNT